MTQKAGITTYIVSDEQCPDGCHPFTVRKTNWRVQGGLVGHYKTLEAALIAAGGFAETKRSRYGDDAQVAMQIANPEFPDSNLMCSNPQGIVDIYA